MKIKEIIRNAYPKIDEYPFMNDLQGGLYTRPDILKAEVVELYRAINTRDDIQRIYKEKLRSAIKHELITKEDLARMEAVIDDEGETEEHIDHFDMRFKLFTGTDITNKSKIHFNQECASVNKEWVGICNDSSLLYLMAAMAGIEDWYAPVSEFFDHMVVALGDRVSGVMGSPDVVDDVLAAAAVAGEEMWPMPIPEGMTDRIHSSKIADLSQHDWVRWGGGLFAAAFLREFTAGLPWAHLDIAGPSFNSGAAWGHTTSGGTGVAVSTLVDFARALAESK